MDPNVNFSPGRGYFFQRQKITDVPMSCTTLYNLVPLPGTKLYFSVTEAHQ